MYRHIDIPTDGSELAETADEWIVAGEIRRSQESVIIVEEPFGWLGVSESKAQRALGSSPNKPSRSRIRCERAEWRGRCGGKQAGVPYDTIKVNDVQPYKAIIATAADEGAISSSWHRTGAADYPQSCWAA